MVSTYQNGRGWRNGAYLFRKWNDLPFYWYAERAKQLLLESQEVAIAEYLAQNDTVDPVLIQGFTDDAAYAGRFTDPLGANCQIEILYQEGPDEEGTNVRRDELTVMFFVIPNPTENQAIGYQSALHYIAVISRIFSAAPGMELTWRPQRVDEDSAEYWDELASRPSLRRVSAIPRVGQGLVDDTPIVQGTYEVSYEVKVGLHRPPP